MNERDFYKVIYRSAPIGKEKIVLELLSIDLDAFDKTNSIKFKAESKITEYDYIDKKDMLTGYNDIIEDIAFRINTHLLSQYNSMVNYLRYKNKINTVYDGYIPKSKVEDMINKLFEYNKILHTEGKNADNFIYYTIDVLRGLLEED